MQDRACFGWTIAIALCGGIGIGCAKRTLDAPGPGPTDHDGGGTAGSGAGGSGAGGAGAASSGAAGEGGPGGGSSGNRPPIDLKALGQPCLSAEECLTAFCADGVCCNTACTGDCMRCNTAGSVGNCGFVSNGGAPRTPGGCPVEVALTCGNDGTCDGAGGCRLRPIGTVCGGGSCDGDAVVGQKVCDGRGACRAGAAVICVPYHCDPATAACRTTCTTDADCGGTTCESTGRCHLIGGAACTRNVECASGFCVAGVCCNIACTGDCVSCNLPGRVGTCSPRSDGCGGPDAASD